MKRVGVAGYNSYKVTEYLRCTVNLSWGKMEIVLGQIIDKMKEMACYK